MSYLKHLIQISHTIGDGLLWFLLQMSNDHQTPRTMTHPRSFKNETNVFKVWGPIINRLLKAAGSRSCLDMPMEVPLLPFDWHTPSRVLSDHSFQPWPTMSSIWLLQGVKRHTSPPTPCLCCWDWFNRQWQHTEGASPADYSPPPAPPHTHTHAHCLWHNPQTPPLFTQTHSHCSDYSPHPGCYSLSLSLTSAKCTRLPGLQLPSHPSLPLVYLTSRAAWGPACHVSPSTTSDSPAKVSFAETGNPTCPDIPLLYSPSTLHVSQVVLFVILDSCVSAGRNSWYSSGFGKWV